MEVRKAVITAGAPFQRSLPLQTFIDQNGTQKAALKILIEEILSAGIEKIAVVIHKGDTPSYQRAVEELGRYVEFIEQDEPLGYAHAVACAASFIGESPFMLLVGDHLYISSCEYSCSKQLLLAAIEAGCSISAVQPTHESLLPYFGTVGGRPLQGKSRFYQIERVIEKPTPTEAEQHLIIPGLRAGYYLCFFGMHVLSPRVISILQEHFKHAVDPRQVELTAALDELAKKEKYLAYIIKGRRYDIGAPYGIFIAQLALALSGKDRDLVLKRIIETLTEFLQ